jgi:3-hydroxybutyryl-CoA dehydrogenase
MLCLQSKIGQKRGMHMELESVKRIGVVGGGVMGGGIAQVLALAGYGVTIRDLTQQILDETRAEVVDRKWSLKRSVERGKLGFDQAAAAIDRIDYTLELATLRDCDFIIEAVPEKLDLKQRVFAELDGAIKPEAILTSNTSGFPIADIVGALPAKRQALCAGMHFSNPVPVMRMCEVIYTPQTSQTTIDTVRGVAEKAGRAVSMVRDAPGTYGFILNRVFAAARREAMKIVADGLATEEDVDKAMITGRNWPAAFFGHRGGIGKQW